MQPDADRRKTSRSKPDRVFRQSLQPQTGQYDDNHDPQAGFSLEKIRFLSKEPVGEFRRRPESEQFFRLTKTAKQAMLVLSSIQPDAARRTTAAALIRQQLEQFKKKGRSKPDRILRHAPGSHYGEGSVFFVRFSMANVTMKG